MLVTIMDLLLISGIIPTASDSYQVRFSNRKRAKRMDKDCGQGTLLIFSFFLEPFQSTSQESILD